MAEFTPINTQEEFDAAIQSRLARERATMEKKYGDYNEITSTLAALQQDVEKYGNAAENAEKVTTLTDQLNAANAKVRAFEIDEMKRKAAKEAGIPGEFFGRIAGETEEEIKEDAEKLAKLIKARNNRGLPMFEPGEGVPGEDDARRKELREFVKQIQNKGE